MSYSHLTLQERYVIYHLVLFDLSFREIGRRLNRHHTTIRREIQRNGTRGIKISILSSLCLSMPFK
jgi:IS30 family transposase